LIAAYSMAGRHEEAIDIAQAMLTEDPKNPVVLSLNGSVYTASNKLLQARKFFEKALQLERGMLSASLGLAKIESNEGHIDAAKSIYRDLVQSGKGGTVPMLALAELSAQQERQDEMLNWLEKARASAPGEIRARIIIANFYLDQGQTDKADAVIREASAIAPGNPEVMAIQGKYLIAKKLYGEALLPLNKLVNEIPTSAYARFLLGETYARLGMLSDAYEHFTNAITIKPDLVAAIGLMAENELKQGNASLSRNYATLLQRIRPDSYLGYKLEGDAWLTGKEYTKANDAFTTAWEKEETASVAIGLFSAAKETDDFDSAIQPILLWLKNNPGDTAARFFLATAYQNANQDNNAIREYKKVLDAAPGNAAALNNLAWLYFIHGDPRAIEMAENAYQSTPDDPSIQDTYGWILVQQGQLDEGSRLLKQALDQLPGNQEIRYHVAEALLRSGNQEEGVLILEKLLDEEKPFAGRVQAERLLAEYQGAE
jgi:putative PEP-CTERM system TPR-repeat lipoprotein